MSCPFCEQKQNPCNFCERQGLPILPLRHAVAATDVGSAPEVIAPMGHGLSEIALTCDNAQYTTRLLRSGYLYVYNDNRRTWQAFVVTSEGYLSEFDIHAISPPDVGEVPFTCSRDAHGYVARCVMIPDAAHAGKVWFGFSDVAWTPAVLQKHQEQTYREQHMRCVNMADWLKGQQLTHTAPFDELGERVSEYALSPDDMQPPLLKSLGNNVCYAPVYRGYDFSPFAFHGLKPELEDITAWAAPHCDIHQPMLLAIDDPTGIAQELSALMQWRLERFMNDDSRAWPLATSSAIGAFKQAVNDQAIKDQIEAGEYLASETVANAGLGMLFDSVRERVEESVEDFRHISTEEARRAKARAWEKYTAQYDEDKQAAFQKRFQEELTTFEASHIIPLATAHATWMKAPILQAAFACNFDPTDIVSGLVFEKVFLRCTQYTADKGPCRAVYQQWIDNPVTDRTNLLMRALVLDQDSVAEAVEQHANSGIALYALPWTRIFGTYKEAFKTVAQGSGVSWTQKLAQSDEIVKFFYHLGGPLAKAFDDGLTTMPTVGTRRLAIGTGARIGAPIIDVVVEGGKKKFRAEIIRQMTSLSGQRFKNSNHLHRAVAEKLRRLEALGFDMEGTETKRWWLLLDENHLTNLPDSFDSMNITQKAQYLADAIDTPEALGRLTKPSWRGMLHSNSRLAVVGLILQGVSLMNASAAKDKAMAHEDTELGVRLWNTRAMMMGAVGELVGEATMYTRAGQISLFRGMNMSSLFRVGGRVLGGAAGIVMAGVDGWRAFQEYQQGDKGIAALYFTSFLLGSTFGFALLMGAAWLTGGVAIIFIVILIGISVLISLFTDNDIQEWLERCYWGELNENQRYQSLEEQHKQFEAVLG